MVIQKVNQENTHSPKGRESREGILPSTITNSFWAFPLSASNTFIFSYAHALPGDSIW